MHSGPADQRISWMLRRMEVVPARHRDIERGSNSVQTEMVWRAVTKENKMSEQIQKIVEARSKVWGHFMIAGQFLDALQFAVSLESLAAELGDEELKATARLLISRSAQEIVDKNQVSKIDKKQDSYNCSFCGSEPPKVRLGGGPNAFICNECVKLFFDFFNTAK